MKTEKQPATIREPWPQAAVQALAQRTSAECWMPHQKSPDENEMLLRLEQHRTWGPLIAAPDCGDGRPAAAMAAAINAAVHAECGHPPEGNRHRPPAITVANEPDENLREAASQILETVVHTSWERTEYVEDAAFCLVDVPRHETTDETIGRLRQASAMLDHEEGVAIVSMPRDQVHPIRQYLSEAWEVRQFRMPGDDSRVIMLGQPAGIGEPEHRTVTRLERLTATEPEPFTGDGDETFPLRYAFHERSRRTPAGLNAVRARRLSHRELVELAARQGSRNLSQYRIAAAGQTDEYGRVRNLAPLTAGHTMMLIAAGQMDNVAITDPQGQHHPIIMKGQVRKVTNRQDNTNTRYISTESYSSSIRYMDLETGEIHQVNEDTPGELQTFFGQRKAGFQKAVRQLFPPRIDPLDDQWQQIRDNMTRRIRGKQPIGKQTADAVTLAAHLSDHRVANLLGRPGSGKTFITLMTVAGMGCSKILIVCPAHVITTWIDEITDVMPLARIRICRKVRENRPAPPWAMPIAECDLWSAMETKDTSPDRPLFIITPQGAASQAGRTRSAVRRVGSADRPGLFRVNQRANKDTSEDNVKASHLEITHQAVDTCPKCWTMLTGRSDYQQNRRDARCPAIVPARNKNGSMTYVKCGQPLREPDLPAIEKGRSIPTRSYPVLNYVAKRRPHWHDLLVIDEVQQYKAQDTQRGEVIGQCAQQSQKVLTLTGTYIGGLASDAFYLLQRTRPGFGREFRWNQLGKFITRYGRFRDIYEGLTIRKTTKFHRTSRREVPGYHPMLLNYLMDNSVFTTLADLKRSLPEEDPRHSLPAPEFIPVLLPLADRPMPGDQMSQKAWYQQLERIVTSEALTAIGNKANASRNVGIAKQALLTGPENCWKEEVITDLEGNTLAKLPALSSQSLFPKEEAMVEIALAERKEGRRFLLYCTHTRSRSVVERTMTVLENAGLNMAYMDPDKVKAEERLDWFKTNARHCDGIVVHPNAVSTGLNLTEFPTIIWQEVSESAITADQASSRSDRINQTQAVRVYYLAYRDTLQHDALSILAAKADAGRSIYGELAKNGLSFMNPLADRFDDIIENELHRELERSQTNQADDTARQALAMVQIRQDNASLREMLKSDQDDHEDVMLVNNAMSWLSNISTGQGNGPRRHSVRRRVATGNADRPKQMRLI